ncbi:MAG: hypothetical protein H6744_13220 [Deltaproteobacteria bacterium]|nr:hypothetical protein [Deltaproteobacteria bacterium]
MCTSNALRVLLAAAWAALVAGSPGEAWAWGADEHAAMGRASYAEACRRLRAQGLEALGRELDEQVPDVTRHALLREGLATRLAIACPPTVELSGDEVPAGAVEDLTRRRAQAYGQATAIGGDHLAEPEQFFERSFGHQIASAMTYAGLGLRNHDHFHPVAPRTWRRVRAQALDEAVRAAALPGTSQVALFEKAFLRHAFADHFLEDSFASGHMGFNRSGSATVAALLFHDEWNERGRLVIDFEGRQWRTFGDGQWEHRCREAPHCQERAIDAGALSVSAFLHAFVVGARQQALEDEAEAAIPRVIESPRVIHSTFGRREFGATMDGDRMAPATAVGRPVYRSRELSVLWLRRSVVGPEDAIGLEYQNTAFPRFSDLRWGLAVALHLPGATVLDVGVRPIALHLHPLTFLGGTLSNALEAAGLDVATRLGSARDRFDGPAFVLYPVGWRLDLELGAIVIRTSARLALAWDKPAGAGGYQRELGWQVALGLAFATSASGGGVWERFHLR